MTERSGLAAKAPETNQRLTPIRNKNRFATPQSVVTRVAGQARRGIVALLKKFGKFIERLIFTRTVRHPKTRRVHMARHAVEVMKLMQKKGIRSFRLSRRAVFTGVCASLMAAASAQAANITMSVQQAGGLDWNTAASWSNGLGAASTVAADPSATFELLPGSRLRSPVDSVDATFPGNVLTVDGDGVFVNNPVVTNLVSEIRFKQNVAGGRVTFPKLVMNGGQLDAGNDGTVTISGEVDILKNTPIYNDGGNDRGYVIDAYLTGAANIEIHAYNKAAFDPTYTRNINVAGATNTFNGQWNVVTGALLATGANGLGTNNITVGAQGALQ